MFNSSTTDKIYVRISGFSFSNCSSSMRALESSCSKKNEKRRKENIKCNQSNRTNVKEKSNLLIIFALVCTIAIKEEEKIN